MRALLATLVLSACSLPAHKPVYYVAGGVTAAVGTALLVSSFTTPCSDNNDIVDGCRSNLKRVDGMMLAPLGLALVTIAALWPDAAPPPATRVGTR